MLTIFTIPKPFTGDSALLQRNAIRSWMALPGVRVILCGDDDGVAEAAREFGCAHLGGLARTSLGTPLLDSAFAGVEAMTTDDLLCYCNADIILLDGFQAALPRIPFPAFLVAGSRLNIWVEAELRVEEPGWAEALWTRAVAEGTWSSPEGSDYFIYRRGTLGPIPAFAVGRPYWDNWMLYRARERGWPLIDGTAVIRAVHQNHGYGHVPQAVGGMWQGPEADENLRVANGIVYSLVDATHRLEERGVRRMNSVRHRSRRLRRRLERVPGWTLLRAAYRLVRGRPAA